MDWGGRARVCLSLALLGLAAGCASVPAGRAPVPPVADEAPATPTIPEPVPVEVVAETEALPPAGEPAAVPEPEPPPPPGNLLERVRKGLALGQHFNSRIDREADYFARNPDYIERVFTRAAPYLYYIVTEVEKRGIPLEIALLPIIESAFQPYAYSRARADGLWQFIPTTGGRFGLKQDWWYDGRRDVIAATQGALDYLTYLHDLFQGNWLHAIAAYNCGEGNVSREIRRNRNAGRRTDFWNLRLPAETRGYVPRLLAMTRIVAEPEKYGLTIEGIPDTPYFEQVDTGGQISIEVAAELAGIATEQMYELNPAYHRQWTDPTGPHRLLVPVTSADAFRESLLQLTPDQRMRVERYAVNEGDTVASIARQFGTTTEHVRQLNGLGNANSIVAGSEVRVPSSVSALPENVLRAAARVDANLPGAVRAVHVVRSGDTLSGIARRHNTTVARLASLNGISQNSTLRIGQRIQLNAGAGGATATTAPTIIDSGSDTEDGRRVTYVVRRGDTLSGIAQTLKVTVDSLRAWNNIDGSTIRPGQRLTAYVRRGS